MPSLDFYLNELIKHNPTDNPGLVSDIYFQVNSVIKINLRQEWVPAGTNGFFEAWKNKIISREEMDGLIKNCQDLNSEKENLMKDLNIDIKNLKDFAISWPQKGEAIMRIRAHIATERNGKTLCLRILPPKPIEFKNLKLIKQVVDMVNNPYGLILVSGVTGGGKSTTIASMVDRYCRGNNGHVKTLEAPIEHIFKFEDKLITQHWVGFHTPTWADGIQDALRDKVNVIVIGEIREIDALKAAVQAANSGQLVIASTHHTYASHVISYLKAMYPTNEQEHAEKVLTEIIIGIVCQRLLPDKTDKGVIPCYEVLVNDSNMKKIARKDGLVGIEKAMQTHDQCVPWNTCLEKLCERGLIDQEIYEKYLRKDGTENSVKR